MPLYEFSCKKCGSIEEKLLKIKEANNAPECSACNVKMERVYSPIISILNGPGWNRGVYIKIKERSKKQGKKFFKRHEKFQELSEQYINNTPND